MECSFNQCKNLVRNPKLCRHCLNAKYCSNECRLQDWQAGHKKSCSQNTYNLKDFLPAKHNKSLGKGAYGEVQLVQHINTRVYYALKVIKKKNLHRSASLKLMYREISVQKKLIHGNIIRLFGHMEDIDNLYLILEYAEKGNLFHYIRKKKRLGEEEAFYYFTQVCCGIHYLHDKSIIHRDVKPENVLLTSSNLVKICDFGWCAEGTEERSTYCGTLDYMAPEILRGNHYTNKVDVWALGVLLFEMTHGRPPFNAKSDAEKSRLIRQGIFKFLEDTSAECKDLIKMILQDNPENRPNVLTILKHPWFSKFIPIVYKDKVNFDHFAPGSSINVEEYGEGIIVNSQGLVCEISFEGGSKIMIIPEIVRNNEGSPSRPLAPRLSKEKPAEECEEKEFEMKLKKNYPPSYKQSIGKPPRTPITSVALGCKIKRKMASENNSGNNSPMLSQVIRSESSNNGIVQKPSSEISDSCSFGSESKSNNSSEGKDAPKTSVYDVDAFENRLKELQLLQAQLEGPKQQKIIAKKPKQKSSFFARVANIFNIGCAER
ncbi:hypothetical protein SteCoe_12820 [Stentor coeruleus]|uniref:Aurora kinase n=1 Tax=Stentor coeruleus TaxID=5963 RepID=A0A1R2C9Z8_9CILI|nr:hypothetical protein SteCoe_12820 [Stentor coeruleus]